MIKDNNFEQEYIMEDKKHRLVIEGNAFYELDLECQRKKKEAEEKKKQIIKKRQMKGQRN